MSSVSDSVSVSRKLNERLVSVKATAMNLAPEKCQVS
jgi:hypothetical protein